MNNNKIYDLISTLVDNYRVFVYCASKPYNNVSVFVRKQVQFNTSSLNGENIRMLKIKHLIL